MATFRLPDLGEGLTEAAVLRWLVAPGDEIAQDQPLVEVETAKAAVEVPSPFAGTVTELHAAEGEEVAVGAPLVSVQTASDVGAPEREPMLVGYGPRTGGAPARRARKSAGSPAPVSAAHPEPAAPVDPAPGGSAAVPDAADPIPTDSPHLAGPLATPDAVPGANSADPTRAADRPRPRAKPPVRKLAKDLGIDLATVRATGPDGTVTRADLEAAAAPASAPPAAVETTAVETTAGETTAAGTTAGGRTGVDRRVPLTAVQRAMADAMVRSTTEAPQATLFLAVDVTASMRLLDRLRAVPELAGTRLSPLLLVARALILAATRHPRINSTFDGDAVIERGAVNLGIAAATPRGLLVPNIPAADGLSFSELAAALDGLVSRARAGKTPPAEMQGGTITITNVGVLGVDVGSPVLNPGESAILAVGAVRPSPWVVDGQLAVREVCQLALTIDHRAVDGELGARVLADVGRVLTDPDVALAWT
jgi:pyruvate dehydrogenase E2 component (dihydrolipoamide acetyltransferase)